MIRNFTDDLVDADLVDELIDRARRAPSAGNSQGTDFVVLTTADDRARFWDASLPVERRAGFAWPGLLMAPVLVLPAGDPDRYVDRYAEEDKVDTGLGTGADAWSTAYWTIDAAMATHGLLLAATDAGLGACLFGLFDNEPAVRAALDVPDRIVLIGAVALGHPAPDRPGRSADRPRRPLDDVMHRGRW